jgi:hypothetical protein
MNKIQQAIGIAASPEVGKDVNVASKRRAGTKKASFKMSRDGVEARAIAAMNKPEPKRPRTVGSYGPKQSIRVWRNHGKLCSSSS